jgi:DNA-directed RNA polymerase subunit omega
MIDRSTRAPRFVIPDDPEQSSYRFIIVAAKRARQLQDGSRSFLPTTSRKPTVTAMEEVRRGLVKYHTAERDVEPDMEPDVEEST